MKIVYAEIEKQKKVVEKLLAEMELKCTKDAAPMFHYLDGKINAFNFCLRLLDPHMGTYERKENE